MVIDSFRRMRMDFLQIAVELLVGFISLFFTTKLLGKVTIIQVTPFEFISALILGELVGNAVYDKETGLAEILFSVIFWGLLIFLIELLTQKSLRMRGFLEGRPSVIIHKGKVRYKELKKNHLDLDQLQYFLRAKDTFSIREVEYAVLEKDGSVSVLKKSNYTIPTRDDHKMPDQPPFLPTTFISDGKLLKENLISNGFNETWLQKQLAKKGIHDYSQVLYAESSEGNSLYVEKY